MVFPLLAGHERSEAGGATSESDGSESYPSSASSEGRRYLLLPFMDISLPLCSGGIQLVWVVFRNWGIASHICRQTGKLALWEVTARYAVGSTISN